MDKILQDMEKRQRRIDYSEFPSGLLETAPEDDYIDIIRAGQELRDCLFMAMRKHLDEVERFTINHTFGLPVRGGEVSRRYTVITRKEQAKRLKDIGIETTAIDLKRIRLKAMAKIFQEIEKLL